MDIDNNLHFKIVICGNTMGGKTSVLTNIVRVERHITFSDLAEKVGISPNILSKILYDVNIASNNMVIQIASNFICNILKEYVHIVFKYRNSIVYYLINFFYKISEHTELNSFIRIRGDTLCFSL